MYTSSIMMCMCTCELAQDKHRSKKFDAWYMNMSSIMKEWLLCITRWGHKLSKQVYGTSKACLFMGSIWCTQVLRSCNGWDGSNSPNMYEETMGASSLAIVEISYGEMDNIQNNAYPKLGGHGMAYEINDAKGAYQYHHKKNKCQ